MREVPYNHIFQIHLWVEISHTKYLFSANETLFRFKIQFRNKLMAMIQRCIRAETVFAMM